jgi:hypothetical protein
MKRHPLPRLLFLGVCLAVFLAPFIAPASEARMRLEAQLIWGTNDDPAQNSELKPIEPKIAKKLENLPIKWKHYYVVNVKEFDVRQKDTTKVQMSKECELVVKNVDGTNVEVQLIGKGKPAGKVTKGLGKGKCLVTGGNAENFTAWFVFLKQVE